MTVTNNLTVNGDLTVTGSNFVANVQTVEIKDNILLLNKGQTGTGVSSLSGAGLEVDRGVFKESAQTFQMGTVGAEETLATQAANATLADNLEDEEDATGVYTNDQCKGPQNAPWMMDIVAMECCYVTCPMTPEFHEACVRTPSVRRRLCAVDPKKFQTCELLIEYHEQHGDKVVVVVDDAISPGQATRFVRMGAYDCVSIGPPLERSVAGLLDAEHPELQRPRWSDSERAILYRMVCRTPEMQAVVSSTTPGLVARHG